MFVRESKRVRNWVGRCHRGQDVHEALAQVAREHGIQSAWVEAIGAFESVELCEYDQAAQAYRPARRIETPTEVLSLKGNLSSLHDQCVAHLHVSLSRESDNGVQLLGGHVQRARVFSLEFRLTSFDDVALVREPDADTGLELWREPGGGGATSQGRAAPRPEPAAAPTSTRRADERLANTPHTMSASPSAPSAAISGVTWAMAAAASA